MSTETLRWGIAAACTVLLLKSDPGARKQYFVIIFGLESPAELITGIKGEYGLWIACIGLAMKIFYHLPGPLEYPLSIYLFIATAPASAVSVRGTLGGTTASTVVACICAYQYFSYMGGFSLAFRRERLIGSCAILFVTVACIFLFGMHAS